MQNIVNLAVILFVYDFFQSPPSPRDAPESGGEGIFSGKEEGYGMTLHANNGKPCCISFRFMNFYSQRGHPPPLIGGTPPP